MGDTAKRPFWMHQLVEYVLGGALVASGLQSPTPIMPAIVGALILAHAAVTRGPLSAFGWIGRTAHRVVDVAVIAVEVLCVAQPFVDVEGGTRLVMAAIAVVHAFVWWQSSFVETVKRSIADGSGDRSTQIGRMAGRFAGNAVNAAKRRRKR